MNLPSTCLERGKKGERQNNRKEREKKNNKRRRKIDIFPLL